MISAFVDYYEVLQVSPKAHPDTIHRVYRILAQRLHPDNHETGDESAFRALLEAYDVLGDSESRSSYDKRYHHERLARRRSLDDWSSMEGLELERRKRDAMLTLLYRRRVQTPHQPSMTPHELEEFLACPKEDLEFATWYLREHGHITRSDSGRVQITAKGVDAAELALDRPVAVVRPMLSAPAA